MDSRLSMMLHLLIHMADERGLLTSEALAKASNTNPVVIRRVLAGLRKRGFVRSEKGHGGGWALARDLSTVTLAEIYDGIGAPPLLAIGNRSESSECLVEQAVNAALQDAFKAAQNAFRSRLEGMSLGDLSTDVHQRFLDRGREASQEAIHG